MGVVLADGIFTGANPAYKVGELAYQIRDSDPRFIICESSNFHVAVEAARAGGVPESNVFLHDGHQIFGGADDSPKSFSNRHWSRLIGSEKDGEQFAWKGSDSNRTIALNYSSGTTGLPKGVEITHRNYVANTEAFVYLAKLQPEYLKVNPRTKALCFLPMYHAMAQTWIFSCVKRGNTVYLMKKFDFIKMLENIQKVPQSA